VLALAAVARRALRRLQARTRLRPRARGRRRRRCPVLLGWG
jgi:hypothetical protein